MLSATAHAEGNHMSKKSMLIAGAIALVVVVVAAIWIATSRGPSPSTTGAGNGSATTSGAAGTASSTTGTTTSTGTTSAATTGTSTTKPNGSGTTTKVPDTAGTYPPLPAKITKAKPTQPTTPVSPGKTLAPLLTAPNPTVSGLLVGTVPEGATYAVVLRPLGIGPPLSNGTRLVVYTYAVTPSGSAPAIPKVNRTWVLVLLDTKNGGTITKGGSYKATMTLHSLDGKMIPVLSQAKLVKG